MSTLAIHPITRAVRFYEAPIGKKAVMAITGVMLVGYVFAHLLGNLQIYSSDAEQINRYAGFLHNPANAAALWRRVACCWWRWRCTSSRPPNSGCKTARRGRSAM